MMFNYMKYGPYICIGIVLLVLFLLWLFFGGKSYNFVGLAPLDPNTCSSYTGSFYNWGNRNNEENITQANIFNNDLIMNLDNNRYNNMPVGLNDNNMGDNNMGDNNYNSYENNSETSICLNPKDTSNISMLENNINKTNVRDVNTNMLIERSLSKNNINNNINKMSETNQNISNLPVCINNNPTIIPSKPRKKFLSRGEKLCCSVMEKIYGVPFISVRPNWLRNPETGENLELDCYNQELQLAVEYNGEQHYNWPNFTNQSYEAFINQVRRDTFKMETCDRNGVYLITVPYKVKYDDIPSYIMSYLPETIQKRLITENTLSTLDFED